MIREWEKELREQRWYRPIKLGRKNKGIDIRCLAFADDIAILMGNTEIATRQIEALKEMAEDIQNVSE